ncbi:MAG: CHAD domain-containing protein [Gemmatimonadaceae bacterium]
MLLPDDLLDRPPEESARRIARSFLDEAGQARPRLADPDDPEGLHDFRVAIRRLRSCLRAHRSELRDGVSRKLERRLRTLAAATGGSRDAEVHLAWLADQAAALTTRQRLGCTWLENRLRKDKRAADDALHSRVAAQFPRVEARLIQALDQYRITVALDAPHAAVPYARVLRDRVRSLARDLERDLAAVTSAADDEPAHEARIAAKRLRYLLEPVTQELGGAPEIVVRLKGLQDTLGDLHDAHVFSRTLLGAMENAAAEQARRLSEAVLAGVPDALAVRRERRHDPRSGLLALAARLADRRDRAFTSLQGDWLGGHAAGFFADIGALAHILDERSVRGQEIERKFLLSSLPARAEQGEPKDVEQGYLPGERLTERVRRVRAGGRTAYFRTLKAGYGVARLEVEEETTAEVFDQLWPLTAGRRLRKQRYVVPDGDVTWELDVFEGRDLVLAEVELRAEDQTIAIPDWLQSHLVREVTGDAAYQNSNLAR